MLISQYFNVIYCIDKNEGLIIIKYRHSPKVLLFGSYGLWRVPIQKNKTIAGIVGGIFMTIKRSGFLCKLAYGHIFSYTKEPPKMTNLCKFSRRVFFSVLFAWPITIIFSTFLITIGTAFTFLFGYRLNLFNEEKFAKEAFVPIGKLNKFPPIIILFCAWVIFCTYHVYDIWPIKLTLNSLDAAAIGTIFSLLMLTFLFFLAKYCSLVDYKKDKKTGAITHKQYEFIGLIKAYLRAKKERVCPMIKIE